MKRAVLARTFAVILGPLRPHFPQPFVYRQSREPHLGKRNFAPRDFGQKARHLKPGDRQIASGDSTSSGQPTELSGFFEPANVLPVRGDWLVVVAVSANRSVSRLSTKAEKMRKDYADLRLTDRTIARKRLNFRAPHKDIQNLDMERFRGFHGNLAPRKWKSST
jgi:hypothetical protein